MSVNEPTGIRNKNYLNIKNTQGSPWMDAGGRESGTDSRGHAVFTDPAYGIRAGILQLRAYFFKHNLRTIAEILSRWAPASDTIGSLPGAPKNSPAEYSAFVAKRMGIGFNQKLDIFKEDKSVGNISRLRDLFYAMSAYEIGNDFKVPDDEFVAGLELVQQGITSAGTGTPAVVPVSAGNNGGPPDESDFKMGGSVGRWDKNPVNAKEDVETVQEMLRQVSVILEEPALDPGTIDGIIGQDAAKSDTVKAIEAFQSRFLARPDGLMSVGGRTWRELVNAVERGDDPEDDSEPATGERPKYYFPFTRLPDQNWTDSPRRFGANRKGRAHAACDLYYPVGTLIHAIGDGTVIQGSTPFYEGTNYIVIDHGEFVARYGEVQPSTLVHEGDRVKASQPIAKVGRLNGMTISMLHLELYDKSAHGPLSVPREKGGKINGRPTGRRRDLMDPTPKLNEWRHNLAGSQAPAHDTAAVTVAGGIPSKGFCIHLKRVRQEKRPSLDFARTVGEYQCYWDGAAIDGLGGQMVERGGPGDNTTEVGNNRDLRVRSGAYRLAVHAGSHYRTYDYNEQEPSYPKHPNPGLLLMDTDERSWILIHPGEDYVKSIGCLNPASALADASAAFAFDDSRTRVIAIIEALKSKLGPKFPKSGAIPDATIFIEGEPV
ncbi:MAG TPA: peptidoglycan DD-metalloendopeptidase family protein [Pyrinomonadaceae bacterium]|jgi:murein DD-endopeptidase MepM/ murein hydrolase activator NlpD|nr:peptidoglycan DD-metalloendopeptidase family protein [Pyrinomonadaceae bacterium]